MIVPVVVILGLAREVDDHVLTCNGAADGLEVGDRRLGVWDARDGVTTQTSEFVAVRQIAEDEPADQPARTGHQHLRLVHVVSSTRNSAPSAPLLYPPAAAPDCPGRL